jgi:hypothetical protein
MQRLLVGLVLVLLVAVAALGIAVYNLDDPRPARETAATRSTPVPDPAAAAREAELERTLQLLKDELASVKRQLSERPAAIKVSPVPVTSGGGGTGEGGFVSAPGVRPRDAEGQLVITEEDAEFFQKVQEKVLRQQRVDSQTKSAMLRVDRMAGRGEIQPLAADRRAEIEKVLRRYVMAGDDVTARLLRSPEDGGLTAEQRRDELTQARSQLLAGAQTDLEPILGVDDAKKVAEESLQRPWGLGRPGRRFENDR